ncbi:hypothetical protein B0H10DRAFT_1778514, partial [Mycena sp. CBHHK59/15]
VPMIRTGLDFLNAKVYSPGARFTELKDIVEGFSFPRLTGWLPITLVHKMVMQNIVSRCRALLSLQPIKQADAEALDIRISSKIHGILGMSFSPSSKILTLPVSHHGFGFPSIARINAGIASHHVTAAATGPATLVVQLMGCNLSILHGELMGHVLALALRDNKAAVPLLYSDHQNSVNLIADIRSRVLQDSRLHGMNGRSYYHWILELVQDRRAIMTYTRGHSAELTLPAQLNREADHYASGSQKFLDLVPVAATPTFMMDTYTLYTTADRWIESNTRNFVDYFLAEAAAAKPAQGNQMQMLTWVHDNQPPPEYPYTRALSAHSAVIQLYAHSGQLPSAETLESRGKIGSCLCRLGCDVVERMHHVFVDCKHFADWHSDARKRQGY